MTTTKNNADGNEERRAVVDGGLFVLERVDDLGEWRVYWDGEPPPGCGPELGALAWLGVPGATATTGLEVTTVDQVDWRAKDALLRRVVAAAGLTLRSPRSS